MTRARVASLAPGALRTTIETSARETPARAATSCRVTRRVPAVPPALRRPSPVRPERGWRRPLAVPPELRLPSAVPPELRLPSAVPPELRRPSAVPPEPTCGMISLLDRLGHR